MYGPPGCGKTMLAKAVAHHTTASFIRVVGSEFVQKYLGEGPRMVRDVFRLAKENSPAIIFIDEIDAIATKRFDAQTGADREVQRILLELLNQVIKLTLNNYSRNLIRAFNQKLTVRACPGNYNESKFSIVWQIYWVWNTKFDVHTTHGMQISISLRYFGSLRSTKKSILKIFRFDMVCREHIGQKFEFLYATYYAKKVKKLKPVLIIESRF